MAAPSGYQHSDAFDSGYLEVGSIHKIYYSQYGRRDGKPVIFLHGGPGGQTTKANTCFFNPEVFRVVLLDQRGAGKSRPVAELRENTTQHLIDDIEVLRQHIGIKKWHVVFGGSWGSTLALAYAQAHPDAVGSLVLRGIFLVRKSELDMFYKGGTSQPFYPEEYEQWLHYLPESERNDPVAGYYKLLTSDDEKTRLSAARTFNRLEMRLSTVVAPADVYERLQDDDWVLSHARIETHYFVNGAFLKPRQLLNEDNLQAIQHIPSERLQQSNVKWKSCS